jgi:glycosyltransferase involved in cell wall biosynthesis
MIAQDEEERIGNALASVRPYVQEIVVVDGGSKDDTIEVARSFGAVIVERPFDRNFGAQQNAGLVRVRSPWTFVLDADEVLAPGLGELLLEVAARADVGSVNIPRLNFLDDQDGPSWWPDVLPRLFRTGILYEGEVHCSLSAHRGTINTPLSGPYLLHHKDMLRQHRASLLYSTIDPTQYNPGYLAWVRSEIARLESARESS